MAHNVVMEFKLITAPDQEIFENRLRDFVVSLGKNVTIGNINFSTAVVPNGDVIYSALVAYRKTEDW
jgi:hypothetical protein